MTRPAAEARSSGSSERMSRQLAVRLTATISSHALTSTWCSGVIGPRIPALPSRTSSRPQRRKIASPSRSSAAKSLRSQGTRVSGDSPPGVERRRLVVELLERALGARERDDMGAGGGERQRRGAADAARGAGHQRDSPGRARNFAHFWHPYPKKSATAERRRLAGRMAEIHEFPKRVAASAAFVYSKCGGGA